ncbi:MAG: right-handed parallel beta-helix repeat-containing protein [Sphingobacteriales bacterium]
MFRKFVVTIAALFLVIQCHAANYYFAASGNDANTTAQAQSKATPWQTITKLNSFFNSIKPGDSILFKCGDTFVGTITPTKPGSAAKPVIFASYGAGARPIITGLVPSTTWVNMGGGIYQAPCPLAGATVNVTTLNGVAQPLGRYPNANTVNSGYLNIDSHTADAQIVSSALNTAVNWTGADVVVRKNHWVITKGKVTSNTATVVNYSEVSAYQPINNWGFFFQNHPSTLDQYGEWYYNPATKQIMMYFGAVVPVNGSVNVSGYDYLVNISVQSYFTFKGLTFFGSNNNAFNIFTCNGLTINNCNFISCGINAIYTNVTTGLVVSNCSFQNINNSGVVSRNMVSTQVSNDTLTNTGIIPGMGQPTDGESYEAIVVTGTKLATITNNIVTNVGYNGIDFGGDSILVKNNYINNFELIKDDGGAIYTYAGGVDSLTNSHGIQLTNNILVNTIGAPAGSTGTFPGCASGIYLDDNTTGVTMTGNSISNCITGVFFHHTRNCVLTGNTIFNNSTQVLFQHNGTKYTIKNNAVSNNIIYSQYKTQQVLSMQSIANDLPRFSTFNNNYYSNTIDNIFPINANGVWLDLNLWQYRYAKDLGSVNTVALPMYNIIMRPSKKSWFANSAFNKNITGASSWAVNGNFLATWNSAGQLDGGSLKGYYSFQSGSTGNSPMFLFNTGAVTAGTVYMLKFSMIATKGHKRLRIYIRNNSAPYNQVTEVKYLEIDSTRTENTVMIKPTASIVNSAIVFSLEDEDISLYLDNVGFYPTNSTLINPATQIFYQYNATNGSVNAKLNGIYYDVHNTKYTGNATIPAFSSVLLFKNPDTTVTKPPVVYSMPIPKQDIATLSTPQKNVNISLYPNPATDYIMLNFNSTDVKDLNIKLLNTRGDIIMNQNVQVQDGSYRLNFTQKPQPGSYFIQVSGSGINQANKVIII